MTYQEFNQLVENLAGGWQPDHAKSALELVNQWRINLKASVHFRQGEQGDVARNTVRFVTHLSEIHLRGMNEVPCLLIGGDGSDGALDFWRKSAGPGRLPFILALSDKAYYQAEQIVTEQRGLLLSAAQIRQLVSSPDPRGFLKSQIHKQIAKQRLIPYDFLKSAEGGMFFGRRNELNRLRHEDGTSFAIAGPGKVGKSSLIKQYRSVMLRERDARATLRFYVDFYDCRDTSPDGVARFFAMKIDPSKQSNRMTADGLLDFLRYQSFRSGGTSLDLLLDEVDEVCNGEAFKMLGEAAKLGHCRLVLCGKGALLRMMLDKDSPLRGRLELVQLEPLDEHSARRLILEPLADLGLEISDPELLINRVFRLTGRLPHLLQLYGKKLASLAIEEESDRITINHIETLKWDFGVAQIFTEPVRNLTDPEARLIALLLLQEGKGSSEDISIQTVQKLAARESLEYDLNHLTEICNELVISNVLAWSNGRYRIANEALFDYAHNLGLLEASEIEQARQIVRAQHTTNSQRS